MDVVGEGGNGSAPATTTRLKGHNGSGGGAAGTDDRIKGPWSPEEDVVLNRLVEKFGARNWSLIARGIPGRSGKSCRLRWCNQLNPGVKRKPFTGTVGILTNLPFLLLLASVDCRARACIRRFRSLCVSYCSLCKLSENQSACRNRMSQ